VQPITVQRLAIPTRMRGLPLSRNLNNIRFALARPLGGDAAYRFRFNR
jgi:hypothetical protein